MRSFLTGEDLLWRIQPGQRIPYLGRGARGPRSAGSLQSADMDLRLLYILEFPQNRHFAPRDVGTAGSFDLRIGYYPNIMEAVKADGEPE